MRFDVRQDSRHEHLADDTRGRAELAEGERIDQLREAELRGAARIEARADELQALRELGTLAQAEPREGDEAVRDLLTRRAGNYVQADVDGWFAHALATHSGHLRRPHPHPGPGIVSAGRPVACGPR